MMMIAKMMTATMIIRTGFWHHLPAIHFDRLKYKAERQPSEAETEIVFVYARARAFYRVNNGVTCQNIIGFINSFSTLFFNLIFYLCSCFVHTNQTEFGLDICIFVYSCVCARSIGKCNERNLATRFIFKQCSQLMLMAFTFLSLAWLLFTNSEFLSNFAK